MAGQLTGIADEFAPSGSAGAAIGGITALVSQACAHGDLLQLQLPPSWTISPRIWSAVAGDAGQGGHGRAGHCTKGRPLPGGWLRVRVRASTVAHKRSQQTLQARNRSPASARYCTATDRDAATSVGLQLRAACHVQVRCGGTADSTVYLRGQHGYQQARLLWYAPTLPLSVPAALLRCIFHAVLPLPPNAAERRQYPGKEFS